MSKPDFRSPVPIVCVLALAFFWHGCVGKGWAPAGDAEPAGVPARLLSAWIDGKRPPWLRHPDFERDVEAVREFYGARSWQLAWLEGGKPTAQAIAMSRLLADAAERGLRPRDYQASSWNLRWQAVELGDFHARAHLDLAFTAAVTDFVHDVRFGRVDPRKLGIDTGEERDPGKLAAIVAQLCAARNVDRELRDLAEPRHPAYHRLLRVLQRLRKSGESAEHGRIPQIELALERWRWLPRDVEGRWIVVNVPEFRLRAYGPSGDAELEMKVVVGDARGNATPLLREQMRTVVFQPEWFVPESIVRNELVPSEASNPGYLAAHRYDVRDEEGQLVEGPVDETVLAALRAGRGSIKQRSGPGNALGRVKFLFPNDYDVYLHDTPVQAAFARERRDLSHGCVRVADPQALARWTLRGVPGWDDGRIAAAMAGSETQSVSLPQPIPVVFVYHTAVVEQDAVRFLPDVYGYDAAFWRAMAGSAEAGSTELTASRPNVAGPPAGVEPSPRAAGAAEAAAL